MQTRDLKLTPRELDLLRSASRANRARGADRPQRRSDLQASLLPTSTEGTVATLRLYDPIDSWGGEWGVSAKELVGALDALPDTVTDVHLHLNSPGGEVYEGLTMLNALRQHRATVTAIVDGIAASAASFIAVGADRTVMARNSQLMIHDAWGVGIGNAADMRALADVLDKISDNIAGLYASKAGGDLADWRGVMTTEAWYSADEAVEAGLADEVDAATEAVAAAFDLSVFQHREPAQPAAECCHLHASDAPERDGAPDDDSAWRQRADLRRRLAQRRRLA